MVKKPISATIDQSLVKWIDDQIKTKREFRNRSHLIEVAIDLLKEKKND